MNRPGSITFKLYDPALHSCYRREDVRIDGTGQIWYNNSTNKDIPLWEPLDMASLEGCELRNVVAEGVEVKVC